MTVADNTSRNQYTATSGQTVFAYTFEIVDKDDIVVLKNGTTLSEGTNYTVSNVGNDSGGNVTLTVGATTGDILTLYRDMPYSRTQNYTNAGDFLASEVNSDFDNLWLAGEQTQRSFSQSIRKPITDSDSISMELPAAADRADRALTFDSTGAVSTAVLSGITPSTISRQQFTGNGSTTVFTLASDLGIGAGVVIYIDGVYQEEGAYTVSGTTLTFSEAPPTNASIEVVSYKVSDIATGDASSISYLPAGTGAVQTTVQTKLRESVSVKDFGAVGDGVTDDTAAIQAAIDAVNNLGGGEAIIPVGTYLVSSAIEIKSHVTLKGTTGWTLFNSFGSGDTPAYNATIIKLADNSNTNVIEFVAGSVAAKLSYVYLNCNKANQSSGSGIVFKSNASAVRSSNQLNEVYVFSAKQTGIHVEQNAFEILIKRTYSDRSDGVGIKCEGEDCAIIDSLAGYSGSYGIEVSAGSFFRSYHCDTFGNQDFGLYVHDCKGARFLALQANGNKIGGVKIAKDTSFSPSAIQFIGCSFFNNSEKTDTSPTEHFPEVLLDSDSSGPFGILFSNCTFGSFGAAANASYAISDTSSVVRVNSVVACNFASSVFDSGIFNNIDDVYQIQACTDTSATLDDSVALNGFTQTKVNNTAAYTESIGYTYKDATFTVDPSIRFVAVNASPGNVSINLPPASDLLPGKELIFRRHDNTANTVTLVPDGSDTLQSGTSSTITGLGSVLRVISDGVSIWFNAN